MATIIFDDEYTGTRYTYGLNSRPVGYAQVPAGWIVQSNRKDSRFNFGTIDYPFELTPEQVYSFELTPVQK